MKEEKIKHLELIQNVITRFNTNSFQLKSMAIAIVSALLALYTSNKKAEFILIGVLPLIIFWFLDAYYLSQERKFRGLYNDLVNGNIQNLKPFEMRPDLYVNGKFSFISALFSKTIWTLYVITSLLLLIVFVYLKI